MKCIYSPSLLNVADIFSKLRSFSTYARQVVPFNDDDFRDILASGDSLLARNGVTRPQAPRVQEAVCADKRFESRTHLEQRVVLADSWNPKAKKKYVKNKVAVKPFLAATTTRAENQTHKTPQDFFKRGHDCNVVTHVASLPNDEEDKKKESLSCHERSVELRRFRFRERTKRFAQVERI